MPNPAQGPTNFTVRDGSVFPNTPIPGARITVYGNADPSVYINVLTDANGNYNNVMVNQEGGQLLIVEKVGYGKFGCVAIGLNNGNSTIFAPRQIYLYPLPQNALLQEETANDAADALTTSVTGTGAFNNA